MQRIALRYGLRLGLAYCGYTTFMWLTRLDTTYLAIGHYLDIAVGVVPLAFTWFAIRAAVQQQRVSVGQRVLVGVLVNLVGGLLYAPFLYAYHTVINPTWFEAVVALKRTELTAAHASAEVIAAEIHRLRAGNSEVATALAGVLVGTVGFGPIVALLTLPFIKNRERERFSRPSV